MLCARSTWAGRGPVPGELGGSSARPASLHDAQRSRRWSERPRTGPHPDRSKGCGCESLSGFERRRGLRATHRTDADGARRGPIRHAPPPCGRRRRHRHRTALYGASPAAWWTWASRAIGRRPGAKGAVCTGKDRPAPARPARVSRPCPVRPRVAGDAASTEWLGVGALGVAWFRASRPASAEGASSRVWPGRAWQSAPSRPARRLTAGGGGAPDRDGFGVEPAPRPGASDTGGWPC